MQFINFKILLFYKEPRNTPPVLFQKSSAVYEIVPKKRLQITASKFQSKVSVNILT